jgi:iron complex transport system substrate-binding protein
MRLLSLPLLLCLFLLPQIGLGRSIQDAAHRTVEVPESINRCICSGSGCLRLLTYLQAQDKIVAVDSAETKKRAIDARPYALANPEFKQQPLFGEFRGQDNPELILTLNPQPQVIFKTYSSSMGYDPDELQAKTGIPVVVLNYGNLTGLRPELYRSLRLMGTILGVSDRAEKVVGFFDQTIADLQQRVKDLNENEKPSVYLGGVAFKGAHGFQSTEPSYPPFLFVGARNLAATPDAGTRELSNSDVAKEQIVGWDPDILFLDLATLQLGDEAGGLHELRTDPSYRSLKAISQGKVYGLLPYNWYTKNYGSILADAYYIGHLLYPDRFQDIDPKAKADEIFTFLVDAPVFAAMNQMFGGLAFAPVPVD